MNGARWVLVLGGESGLPCGAEGEERMVVVWSMLLSLGQAEGCVEVMCEGRAVESIYLGIQTIQSMGQAIRVIRLPLRLQSRKAESTDSPPTSDDCRNAINPRPEGENAGTRTRAAHHFDLPCPL